MRVIQFVISSVGFAGVCGMTLQSPLRHRAPPRVSTDVPVPLVPVPLREESFPEEEVAMEVPKLIPRLRQSFEGRDLRVDIAMGLTEGLVFELSKLVVDMVTFPITGIRISHALNSAQDEASYLVRGIIQEIFLNLASVPVKTQVKRDSPVALLARRGPRAKQAPLSPKRVSLLIDMEQLQTTMEWSAVPSQASPSPTPAPASPDHPPLTPSFGALNMATPCTSGPCTLSLDGDDDDQDQDQDQDIGLIGLLHDDGWDDQRSNKTGERWSPALLPADDEVYGRWAPSYGTLSNPGIPGLFPWRTWTHGGADADSGANGFNGTKAAGSLASVQGQGQGQGLGLGLGLGRPRVRSEETKRRRIRVATVVLLRSFVAPLLLHSIGHSVPSFLSHGLVEEVEELVDMVER